MSNNPNEQPIRFDPDDPARQAARFDPGIGGRGDLRVLTTLVAMAGTPLTEAQARATKPCPYPAPGTILWVRDYTWRGEDGTLQYSSEHTCHSGRNKPEWRTPAKMPRRDAKMFLRVLDVQLIHGRCPTPKHQPSWRWEAKVEVVRDRNAKLCPPGPEAVWRGDFFAAVTYDDNSAQRVALEKLTPLIERGDWEELRAHLLTFAKCWLRTVENGALMTRAVMVLVKSHRKHVGDAWAAIVKRRQLEVERAKWLKRTIEAEEQ